MTEHPFLSELFF